MGGGLKMGSRSYFGFFFFLAHASATAHYIKEKALSGRPHLIFAIIIIAL